MKRTIIKTALYTVLSLILALFLGVFSIFAFAPRLSAKICYDLGMNKLSSSCYERVYKKTGDLDDLIMVIDSAVYAEKQDTVIEYGLVLFDTYGNTNEFYEYCKSCDLGLEEGAYPTFDYYANTVFMALYTQNRKQEAANFAIINMGTYSDTSVLKMAMMIADPTNDQAFGELLVSVYKSKLNYINTSNYTLFIKDMKQYKNAENKQVYKI